MTRSLRLMWQKQARKSAPTAVSSGTAAALETGTDWRTRCGPARCDRMDTGTPEHNGVDVGSGKGRVRPGKSELQGMIHGQQMQRMAMPDCLCRHACPAASWTAQQHVEGKCHSLWHQECVRASMSSTPLKLNCVSMSVSSARRDPGWLFFSTRAYLVSSDVNWKPLQRKKVTAGEPCGGHCRSLPLLQEELRAVSRANKTNAFSAARSTARHARRSQLPEHGLRGLRTCGRCRPGRPARRR